MTKVVSYLFDNMFQSKRKISTKEKMAVILSAVFLLAATVVAVF